MSENHILPDLRIGYKKSRAEVFSMNLLWGGMLLVGILYGAFNGRMQEIPPPSPVALFFRSKRM